MIRIATHITFFLLLFGGTASGQIFNTISYLCDTCSNELSLSFESTSFQKNNEFESEFAQGLTGIGIQVQPSLEYYFNENTKGKLGVYALKFSGRDELSKVIPVFSIQHKICDGLELVFGNIYGNLNHELDEPLYRFDRYYRNNVEYGFQALHKSKYATVDLWVNWEQFIFEGDPFQEEFMVGNHTKFNILNWKGLSLQGDAQVLISHKGGEIDTYDGASIYIFNGGYGVNARYQFKNLSVGITPRLYWYRGVRIPDVGNNSFKYKHGSAFYLRGDVEHKYFRFEAGIWKSEKFVSARGEALFMNISENDEKVFQKHRNIVTSKLALKRQISSNLHLELRAEMYVSLIHDALPDHTYGFYFVANENFFISKLKKRK